MDRDNGVSVPVFVFRSPWLDLECLRPREQTAVHSVNDGLCTDLPTAKVSSVQTLDCILATADTLELEIDVARGVGVE